MSTPEVKEPIESDEDEQADEPDDQEAEPMDFEELDEMTGGPQTKREQAMSKASGARKALRSLRKKTRLTDQLLALLSRYTEYVMVGFITLAVLSVVGFGIHFAVAGLAVPYMLYVQTLIGSLISAFGLLVLKIILEGGTEYLASRVR